MTVITMSRNELTRLRVLIVALRLPTLVFLLYQKGRDSRIFQAQDGYDRRDSELGKRLIPLSQVSQYVV